jgi:ABC-type enterochelin transport system permease subunit
MLGAVFLGIPGGLVSAVIAYPYGLSTALIAYMCGGVVFVLLPGLLRPRFSDQSGWL